MATRPKGKKGPGRQQRLRESVEQFRLAQEALGIVTWVWEIGEDRTQWYGDPSRLLGVAPGQFGGTFRHYMEHLHADDVAQARRTFVDCLKGKEKEYRSLERVVWPDGSVHWLETYGRGTYNAKGRAVRMVGVIKDITERKREESARAKAEQQLAKVFGASPDYIVMVRADDGKVIAANPAFETITGYPAAEIVGRTVGELNIWALPGERERFLSDLKKTGSLKNRPVLLRTSAGPVVSGRMSATLFEHDGEKLIVSLMHDVSEVKQLERRARQSETKYGALFASSPEAIVITRLADAKILDVNAAWEIYTGHRREDAIGRRGADLNRWVEPAQRDVAVKRLLAEGSFSNFETRFLHRDGSEMEALVSAARIEVDGEACAIWSWRDVSDMRAAERRAKQSETKYGALFASNPEPIIITRISDGRILEVNEAWERDCRYRREDVIGRTALNQNFWVDPQQRKHVVSCLQSAGRVSNYEVLFRRADGAVVEALLSAARIEVDGEACAIWSWRNMTEVRTAERRARQSESKFAALFATSPVGLVVTRPRDRRVVEVNDAALALIGVARDEAMGSLVADLGTILNRPEVEEARERALAGERGMSLPLRFQRRDGKVVEAEMSGVVVDLDSEPHFVLSVLDMTEQRRVERERHEAERKFAELFENSPEPISLLRLRDEVRLAANSAWERVTGHSREQASSRPATAMSMFREPKERAALIARVANEGRVSNYEIRLVRADGAEFDALISGSRIEVDGEPCILWTWSDVTEQKEAQRALRESEARFRALTELSADWYWEQDENLRFVWQRSESTHPKDGRPPNQIGLTRWEAHPESLSADAWAAHRAQLEAHESFRNLEFPTRGADGVMRWVSVSGHPIFDDKGVFRGYRGVGRDITERKRNESLLMNIARGVSAEVGDAFFKSLAGHLARELGADFAFIGELAGPDHKRMRTLALLAYGRMVPNPDYDIAGSISELPLKRGGTVVQSSGLRELLPENEHVRAHEIQAYVGTPLLGADGTVLGVLAVAHRKPLERGAFWASMIEIFGARAAAEIQRSRAEAQVREMNESLETIVRERTSQLEDANRELESYNFSISHDLRQPLSAIAGFADLLRDQATDLDDAARDSVAEIESNALRMEQMIESLLRLSRAGRGALRKEPIEAKSLVESVVHDLSTANPLDAELVVGELPPTQADPALLRQVWTNLIGNALKYSRQNAAPKVEISGVRRNGVVEYAVRDNGVGFDMKHAERLFGAFQRLPTSRGFEGHGVGLAIVERIVRRHGGSIRAESIPGKGATFRFTLPQ